MKEHAYLAKEAAEANGRSLRRESQEERDHLEKLLAPCVCS